jgi:outer membrane protein assembly factor BamE (lipoprotein component of BamABCDE complex)
MSLVVMVLLAVATSTAVPQPAAVPRGMTREQVRTALGPPFQVSRQLLSRRHLEQWHYVDPPRTVEFNCVRGEEPYVLQSRVD